jgi:uncharacterized protein YkwD
MSSKGRSAAKRRRLHRSTPGMRYWAAAVAATVLAVTTTAAVAGWAEQASPRPDARPGPSTAAAPVAATPGTGSSRKAVPPSHATARIQVRPSGRPKATRPSERAASTPAGSVSGTTHVPPATTAPPPRPPAPAPHAPSPGGGGSTGAASIAAAVVAAINSARAQQGLPALTVSAGLQASAHTHDLAMAAANQLSHQLPGEPDIGTRETNAGVSWTAAGENIGWTTDMTQAGALSIEASMVGETPPNDGHRRNILSSTFTVVGVDTYLDLAHGRLWLTEDFARLA